MSERMPPTEFMKALLCDTFSNDRYVCENPDCRAAFAEYINGCPKCSERGLHFSVHFLRGGE